MGKKINELTAVSDDTANNPFQLLPLCDPSSGISGKMTIGQAKAAFGPTRLIFKATGSEGTSIVITALAGKNILSISREASVIYEIATGGASPDSTEYTWDETTIVVGTPMIANERLLILYRNA